MRLTDELALLAGRLLIGLFHLILALDRFTGLAADTAWYGRLGVPWPQVAAPLAGVVMGLSGLLVVLGWKTRFGALLFASFLALDAIVVHSGLGSSTDRIFFLFDLAVIGGCLVLYASGPGRLSVDGRRPRE